MGLCGSTSIFARNVVTQRSMLRGVTITELPHTAFRISLRASALPGCAAKCASSLNSLAVSSTSRPPRNSLCAVRSNANSPNRVTPSCPDFRRRRKAGAPCRLFALLGGHLGGNAAAGPDLAMRMRIAGAHHFAAILENLHVADVWLPAQLGVLRGPDVHHQREIGHTPI